MDFELSDDEVALAKSVRSLCDGRIPLEWLQQQASAAEPAPIDPERWMSLAEAGVFSLQIGEEAGGVGLGMGPSVVVFEELGRALVPGPLVSTHLAARDLSHAFKGAAEGKGLVGAVRRPVSHITKDLAPVLVPHLDSIDSLVIVDDEGLFAVDRADLDGTRIGRSLDPLTPLWQVGTLPKGTQVGAASAAARWKRDEDVLTAAILAGLASRCVEMAVEYAKSREQFGKPIGSFQAIKHICADMLVRAETARVATEAAAVTIDQPGVGDAERAAAGAAWLASEAAQLNGRACIQVHGGMGFTWEVPAHLYLMRARTLSDLLETRGELSELVAEHF